MTEHREIAERLAKLAERVRFNRGWFAADHLHGKSMDQWVEELESCRDALNAQTIQRDSSEICQSVRGLWAEVNGLRDKRWPQGGGDPAAVFLIDRDAALSDVLEVLERRGITERSNDSGKSGAVASSEGSNDQSPTNGAEALYEADKGGTSEAPSFDEIQRGASMLGEALRSALRAAVDASFAGRAVARSVMTNPDGGTVTHSATVPVRAEFTAPEAAPDPTQEERRARFERIAAEPRPSSAEIKVMLERLSGPSEWGYMDCADGGFIADNTPDKAADTLDRLGVHAIKLEAELEDLRGRLEGAEDELDTIASNAVPWGAHSRAELIERARRTSDNLKRQGIVMAPVRSIVDQLIGALNDASRARQAAEEALGAANRDLAILRSNQPGR